MKSTAVIKILKFQRQFTRRVFVPRNAASTAGRRQLEAENPVPDLQEVLRPSVAARTSAAAHQRADLRVHRRRMSDEFHAQGESAEPRRERAQERRRQRQVTECLPGVRQKVPEQVSDDVEIPLTN